MTAAVILDGAEDPGAWRAAIEPNAYCKGCGQLRCSHPDAVYQGVVPLPVPRP